MSNDKFVKRFLIDLDGVLNEYGKAKFEQEKFPKIKKGAVNFLKKVNKQGEIYLFTTRNLKLASKWLYDNKIDKYFKDVTNVKLPSFLYIDDRCICFTGNYKQTLEEIKNFKVYWK